MIWIAACELEESQNNTEILKKILSNAIESLKSVRIEIRRDYWIEQAYICEKNGYVSTAQNIIFIILDVGTSICFFYRG